MLLHAPDTHADGGRTVLLFSSSRAFASPADTTAQVTRVARQSEDELGIKVKTRDFR